MELLEYSCLLWSLLLGLRPQLGYKMLHPYAKQYICLTCSALGCRKISKIQTRLDWFIFGCMRGGAYHMRVMWWQCDHARCSIGPVSMILQPIHWKFKLFLMNPAWLGFRMVHCGIIGRFWTVILQCWQVSDTRLQWLQPQLLVGSVYLRITPCHSKISNVKKNIYTKIVSL